jgi:Fe-S-cluster containining protein
MTIKIKRRLPLVAARSLAEAQSARQELATTYQQQLFPKLAEENEAVSCTQKCSNCCYHPVYATLLEGCTIYSWLSEHALWSTELKQALLDTQDRVKGLAVEVWMLSLIPCPLLKDDLCSAYEVRPFACQVTYSIGDPNECHPHRLGPGMLPRKDLYEALAVVEARILKRHHLRHFRIPLAAAVLWGEKIVKGEVELDDSQAALMEMIDV